MRNDTESNGQALGFDGDLLAVLQGWNEHLLMAATAFLRQQGNEGLLQAGAAGARAQFGGTAFGQHAAGIHRHQVVEALGFLHIGCGHQHAHLWALRANARDQFPELVA